MAKKVKTYKQGFHINMLILEKEQESIMTQICKDVEQLRRDILQTGQTLHLNRLIMWGDPYVINFDRAFLINMNSSEKGVEKQFEELGIKEYKICHYDGTTLGIAQYIFNMMYQVITFMEEMDHPMILGYKLEYFMGKKV